MGNTGNNLKKQLPFIVIILIVIIVLMRMLVYGSASPYQTENTDPAVIYQEACSGCHGTQGIGVQFYIPDLADESVTIDEVKTKVKNGGLFMPAYKKLNEIQTAALSEYVAGKNFK